MGNKRNKIKKNAVMLNVPKPLSEKLSHGTKSIPVDYLQITKRKLYLYNRASRVTTLTKQTRVTY